MVLAYYFPSIQVNGFYSGLIASLLLGLVNAIVRPILPLLTLPLYFLTLGLFTFAINAVLFCFVASVVKGF